MLQIEELKQELLAQQPKIEYLKEALGYQKLLEQKKQLDKQAAHLFICGYSYLLFSFGKSGQRT